MPAPRGRQSNVTGSGKGVQRRGSGLGTGPVGSGSFGGGRKTSSGSGTHLGGPQPHHSSGNGGQPGYPFPGGGTRIGGGGARLIFLVIVIFIIIGGKGLFSAFGGGSSQGGGSNPVNLVSSLLGGGSSPYLSNVSTSSSPWGSDKNTGVLNREVSPEAREKYTQILGNGKDVVTVMVYMCGCDSVRQCECHCIYRRMQGLEEQHRFFIRQPDLQGSRRWKARVP